MGERLRLLFHLAAAFLPHNAKRGFVANLSDNLQTLPVLDVSPFSITIMVKQLAFMEHIAWNGNQARLFGGGDSMAAGPCHIISLTLNYE